MLYLREFEITEPDKDGLCAALPFGLPGATQGEGFDEAMEMAADWLYHTVQDDLIRGEDVPEPRFGNEPENGGRVVTIAVDVDLSRSDAVTAADAARMLGVSTARVAQMCESGKLTSWRDGSKRLILRDSVNARLAEAPKAGRPKKVAIA